MTTSAATQDAPTTIALVADGEDASRWAYSLRGPGGIVVDPIGTHTPDEMLERITDPAVDGVVFAQSFPELPQAIKRALIARKHVLSAGAVADSHLLLVLEELARSRGLALLFDAGELSDPRIEHVRRLTRAEHELRRVRYVRSMTAAPDADTVDEPAVHALARVAPLLGLPQTVTACGAAGEQDGRPAWATIIARFPDGASASVSISTMEPERGSEMVVVSATKTYVLDEGSQQLVSRGPVPRRDGVREERSRATGWSNEDRLSITFLDAVREGAFQSNARELARGALIWEMAKTSMARDGEPISLPAVHPLVAIARPNLQVIVGGGHTTTEGAAPRLKVMAGGRRDDREWPSTPPPQSA